MKLATQTDGKFHTPENGLLEIYEPPEPIFRSDDYKDRYYYKVRDNQILWFISNTTWIQKVIPPSPFLIAWWKKNSQDEIGQILDDSSEYGTFMHMVFDWIIRGEEWNSDDKKWKSQFIAAHCAVENIACDQATIDEWTYNIEKAIRSLLVFIRERNINPIASELMLGGQINGFSYAGTLDLPCQMDWNGKKVMALVDYKSGNIWDEHVYQLLGYQLLWNTHYPNRKITHIFNWKPKDWTKNPTYELKCWNTDKNYESSKEQFRLYLEIAKHKCDPAPRDDIEFSGQLSIGEETENSYRFISATDRELKKFQQ